MNMDFGSKKTHVEVIKKEAFGGTYFRNIFSDINGKWHKNSWKEFEESRNIDQNYYCSNYYNVSVNKYCVKCRTSLRFWENNGCINCIDLCGRFKWYMRYWLGRRSNIRLNTGWKEILSRIKGKLIKMIKDVNGRFDGYLISPKIRQILLHWGYELVESDLL